MVHRRAAIARFYLEKSGGAAAIASLLSAAAMQRSGETIGTIAAALAKAQTELNNPKNALDAMVRRDDQRERGAGTEVLAKGTKWLTL